jgi:hypothetical protein
MAMASPYSSLPIGDFLLYGYTNIPGSATVLNCLHVSGLYETALIYHTLGQETKEGKYLGQTKE